MSDDHQSNTIARCALREFNWEKYRTQYGDIQRLDLILESEGDSPNRYKLSKQTDVVMLFYLFSSEELGGHRQLIVDGIAKGAMG
jgi:trehalose/maltose hydrolase-like predicted phosphorylase